LGFVAGASFTADTHQAGQLFPGTGVAKSILLDGSQYRPAFTDINLAMILVHGFGITLYWPGI
jgi:hypothetical protein